MPEADDDDMTAEELAQRQEAEKLFRGPCTFLKGVVSVEGLPGDDRVEVAFAGRSNVGKSSLINALLGRKAMARTSNTPGRTREINYFTLGERLYLVDMPGYGYAKASKDMVAGWNQLIQDYLRGRAALTRVFLLIDSRHGIKDNDNQIMALLDEMAVSYQIVLTKLDKLKVAERETIVAKTLKQLATHPAAFPEVIATSSEKRIGLEDLRLAVYQLSQ
jgi:GTP-binding protein